MIGAARELAERGLNNGTTGNLSVRLTESFLITPTRSSYIGLRPRDLSVVDLDSKGADHGTVPSSDAPMHAAIYAANPAAGAIVHHHGPFSTAWSFRAQDLDPRLEEDRYYGIGPVRTLGSATQSPGGPEAAAKALRNSKAVLIRAHGLVAVGATVEDACNISIAVEHEAEVAWLVATANQHERRLDS